MNEKPKPFANSFYFDEEIKRFVTNQDFRNKKRNFVLPTTFSNKIKLISEIIF